MKFSSKFFFFIFSLAIVGCSNSSSTNPSSFLNNHRHNHAQDSKECRQRKSDEIRGALKEVLSTEELWEIEALKQMRTISHFASFSTPVQPLIITETDFENFFNKAKENLPESLQDKLSKKDAFIKAWSHLSKEEKNQAGFYLGRVRDLYHHAKRIDSVYCSLPETSENIEAIKALGSLKHGHFFTNKEGKWETLEESYKEVHLGRMKETCTFYNDERKEVCNDFFAAEIRMEKLTEGSFYQAWKKDMHIIWAENSKISRSEQAIECKRENSRFNLSIKMAPLSNDRKDALSGALRPWVSKKLAISLIEEKSKYQKRVEFSFHDGQVYSVRSGSKNTLLRWGKAKKEQQILTHELGHLWGFKDCYHEYFNPSKDNNGWSYQFFILDRQNIMCDAFKGHVNPELRQQIIENYCRG